jgi:hypothetical protein
MLLCTVPGATSFQFLRTVNGTTYPTFKAACTALGLLASDEEYDFCLTEASAMQTGRQLRRLFCTILLECTPRNPQNLWDKYSAAITDDCKYLLRQRGFLDAEITAAHVESLGLILVDEQLQLAGKCLRDFHLRSPSIALQLLNEGRIIAEERSFNRELLQQALATGIPQLNPDQRKVFDTVTQAYLNQEPRVFMLDGPGGCGKTHVENLILAFVRQRGDIALAVASTGISAILLDNGRTSYSRFKIPLELTSDSACTIMCQSHLAELFRLTRLLLWDEIGSQHRFAVEAVNRALQDIRNSAELFGGIPTLLSGMSNLNQCNRKLTAKYTLR